MFWSSARKGLYRAVAVYLALATMGTFMFMSFDALYNEDFTGKSTAQGVFLTSLAHPVECLAINAAKDHSFSPPRQCLPRMVLPASFFVAAPGLLCAAVRLITRSAARNKKSAILLKLRI